MRRRCGRSSRTTPARTARPDAPRVPRPGAGRGVRRRADPPARAHAPRPEGGPPAADPGDEGQPLPHLLPVLRPGGRGLAALERVTDASRGRRPTDEDGTVNRLWRVDRPAARSSTVTGGAADAELLIADGHHRYETARVYAEEIGGEGPHRYVLMCLVALEDPGLTVFPTHRLVRGPRARAAGGARRGDAARLRDRRAREHRRAAPPTGRQPVSIGYIDAHFHRPFMLTLQGPGDRRRRAARTRRSPTAGSTPRCWRR